MTGACYADSKGPVPGHVVAVTTLLASGFRSPRGLEFQSRTSSAFVKAGGILSFALAPSAMLNTNFALTGIGTRVMPNANKLVEIAIEDGRNAIK